MADERVDATASGIGINAEDGGSHSRHSDQPALFCGVQVSKPARGLDRPMARLGEADPDMTTNSVTFSAGRPQMPSGGGCIAPPMRPCPSTRMSINALRSSVSDRARRSSGSSNGGFAGLMIRLRAPLSVVSVQVASDTWLLMSRNSGIETPYDKVISTLSAMNIRLRVATLGTIGNSSPS